MRAISMHSTVYLLVAVLQFSAFPSRSSAQATPQPASSQTSPGLLLDTKDFPSASSDFFFRLFESAQTPLLQDVETHLKQYPLEASFSALTEKMHFGFFDALKIPRTEDGGYELESWSAKNPDIIEGLGLYTSDPGDDSAQYWKVINKKLRDKQKMTKKEANVFAKISKAIAAIPAVKGLGFRGASIDSSRLSTLKPGDTYSDAAFVSTSIDPNIAQKFIAAESPGRTPALYILKIKNGAPVSALHFEYHGEYEMLLSAGQTFKVHHVLRDPAKKFAIVIAEQL